MYISHPCTNLTNANLFARIEKMIASQKIDQWKSETILNFLKFIFLNKTVVQDLLRQDTCEGDLSTHIKHHKMMTLGINEEVPRSFDTDIVLVLIKGEISVTYVNKLHSDIDKVNLEKTNTINAKESNNNIDIRPRNSFLAMQKRISITNQDINQLPSKHFVAQNVSISQQNKSNHFKNGLGARMKHLLEFQKSLLSGHNQDSFVLPLRKKVTIQAQPNSTVQLKTSLQNIGTTIFNYKPGCYLVATSLSERIKCKVKYTAAQPCLFLVIKNISLTATVRKYIEQKRNKLRKFYAQIFSLENSDFSHKIFLENILNFAQVFL